MNPWNLTQRQKEACDLLIELGWLKLVAASMNVSKKMVEEHLRYARMKANVTSNVVLAVEYYKLKELQ